MFHFFSFFPMLSELQDLSSRPGMGPRPSAVKAPSSFYPLGCWGVPSLGLNLRKNEDSQLSWATICKSENEEGTESGS